MVLMQWYLFNVSVHKHTEQSSISIVVCICDNMDKEQTCLAPCMSWKEKESISVQNLNRMIPTSNMCKLISQLQHHILLHILLFYVHLDYAVYVPHHKWICLPFVPK